MTCARTRRRRRRRRSSATASRSSRGRRGARRRRVRARARRRRDLPGGRGRGRARDGRGARARVRPRRAQRRAQGAVRGGQRRRRRAEPRLEAAREQAADAVEPKFLSGVVHQMHNGHSMDAGLERRARSSSRSSRPTGCGTRARARRDRERVAADAAGREGPARAPAASTRSRRATSPSRASTRRASARRAARGAPTRSSGSTTPAMKPSECLLFKTFDSAGGDAAGGNVARFALHGAFELPAAAPDAPARESIELRCLVLFDEDAARDDFLLRPFVAPHIARVCGDPSVGPSATGHEPEEREGRGAAGYLVSRMSDTHPRGTISDRVERTGSGLCDFSFRARHGRSRCALPASSSSARREHPFPQLTAKTGSNGVLRRSAIARLARPAPRGGRRFRQVRSHRRPAPHTCHARLLDCSRGVREPWTAAGEGEGEGSRAKICLEIRHRAG